MLSWAVQRDIFYTERDRIRKEFEANLHLKDLGVVEKCIADGEAKLALAHLAIDAVPISARTHTDRQ